MDKLQDVHHHQDQKAIGRYSNFIVPIAAGAIAGMTVDVFFYPIDTLKTRLQARQGFLSSGGFNGLYKGLGSVAAGSAPGAALFFLSYEHSKSSILPTLAPSLSSPMVHMISASIGEIAACLIRVPTEIVKQRQQTSVYGSKTSSAHALQLIIRQGGLKSLYQGFGITVFREVPFSIIQFPLYEALKTYAIQYRKSTSDPLPSPIAALCGSFAGATAAALTTPLDVIKTRVMLAQQTSHNKIKLQLILRQLYQEEGWSALWKGVLPRTIWIGLGGAVFLGCYELSVNQIRLLVN
ncbi:hypothetical protein O181_022792 [Austropuccinia psidii MF-1]|uniref:S-adenosylmethionine transporter n=1 Tax=Austropuccinia psidii MF-1 TaxID=1389203 RepID=A0A9Q3CIA0_9BASI|nr:hypothetical protein [Austropuccinia psidii MF-1]